MKVVIAAIVIACAILSDPANGAANGKKVKQWTSAVVNDSYKKAGHHQVISNDAGSNCKNCANNVTKIASDAKNVGRKPLDVSARLFRSLKPSRQWCEGQKKSTFYCRRIKLYTWMSREMRKNSTSVNKFVEVVRQPGNRTRGDPSSFEVVDSQTSWLDSVVQKLGQPADQLAYKSVKSYLSKAEVKVSLPFKNTYVAVAPNTHRGEAGETGRIFFDPGFNLKMKLPFFRDELKFAVSTGPSFIAGLGVGMVILGIKALMSPMMFGIKAMMWNYFMKDASPFDVALRAFGLAGDPEETQHVEVYNPPPPNHHYENLLNKPQAPAGPTGWSGPSASGPDYNVGGYSAPSAVHHTGGARVNQLVPYLVQNWPISMSTSSGLSSASSALSNAATSLLKQQASSLAQTWLTGVNKANSDEGGLQRPLLTGPGPAPLVNVNKGGYSNNVLKAETSKKQEVQETGFKYVPSAAPHLEVENYDPFYSPLLSRIDSIFMHLGFTDEGCRERAVCSIYKSPVKYAPYSNLLSAQLSKHQSELKRPASTSPKVLRYFKYMKAAKDGQGHLNCIELYPKCTNDTDKLTNLPMVKTFQQLNELISSGPSNSG